MVLQRVRPGAAGAGRCACWAVWRGWGAAGWWLCACWAAAGAGRCACCTCWAAWLGGDRGARPRGSACPLTPAAPVARVQGFILLEGLPQIPAVPASALGAYKKAYDGLRAHLLMGFADLRAKRRTLLNPGFLGSIVLTATSAEALLQFDLIAEGDLLGGEKGRGAPRQE